MAESPERKCYGCQRLLAEGVRFCIACGTHNFDADAANLATAENEIKAYNFRSAAKAFTYWWRLLVSGIRR